MTTRRNTKEIARSGRAEEHETRVRARVRTQESSKSLRKSADFSAPASEVLPSAELAPAGPPSVQQIIGALVAQGDRRDANGRFTSNNTGHLQTLEHSAQLRAALAPIKADLVQRTRVQLGADDDDAPETLLGVIDMYCEARLLRSSAFVRIGQLGGFMTAKGKARALLATWASAFDRELRAAERLGLTRRARRAQSPAEWLNSLDAEEGEGSNAQAEDQAADQATGRR